SGHYSSSQSSHYTSSHYSSSHYSSAASSSSSSSSSSTTTSKASSAYSALKNTTDYTLGERTIKIGTYGTDVDYLIELLIKKRYMKKNVFSKQSGHYVYNSTLAATIKRFQKDAGIPQTGNVDNLTSTELKTWDENKTSIELGFRELSKGDSGTDVAKLVELLSIAGYQPDPQKVSITSGSTNFNDDVETAVKMFQAYNNLPVTGKADEQTIAKLKNRK
ncbi:MAG: peptidoglycan-binding protein, partial [Bacteroidales bacterium]|nr:peptidoglycan-binding protein [Bacteroidales bacterium]